MNELKELRDFCAAVPSPAPSRLTKARDRLDAEIAREAGTPRPVMPWRRAVPFSRWRWPAWVAPLASAAALIAVVAGTFAVVGAVRGARPGSTPQPVAGTYPHLVCVLSQGGIVTRIRDGRVLAPIHVKASGDAIAVTPDGKTAYVAATRGERRPGVVIPIHLATGEVLKPIPVGIWPNAISVTPDGRTVFVTNFLSGTVTPIATATNTARAPVKVGSRPDEVVAAPDGRTLYASKDGSITPVLTATGARLRPLRIPGLGLAQPGHEIVVTPGSRTVYALGLGSGLGTIHGMVTPIQQDHALTPIIVPPNPDSMTLAPGGRTAYVVSIPWPPGARRQHHQDTITQVDLGNGAAPPPLTVPASSNGWGNIVIAPGGRTAYFLDTLLGEVTPVNLATRTVGEPIPAGKGSYTMLFGQGASIGYLIESDRVVPLNTATDTTLRPIKLPAVIDYGEAVRR